MKTKANNKSKAALGYAIEYAKLGIPVIWIPRGSKAPVEKNWPDKATTDPKTIKRWAAQNPGCNFGLVMGNGFVAVDIDDRAELSKLAEQGFPDTRIHATARGAHLLYKVPNDLKIENRVRVGGRDLDIRGSGGQVVCPGSVHPSGFVYKCLNSETPIAQLPDALLSKLASAKPSKPSAATTGVIRAGNRNNAMMRLAGSMRRQGAGEAAILAALRERNNDCQPPLDDDELQTIAGSASRYEPDASIQATLNDERPKILLPGDDRLMSDVAAELGEHLTDQLYVHNGEIVALDGDVLRAVNVQTFRTLVEQAVVCCRKRSSKNGVVEVGVTMTVEESRGILKSPQFSERLRHVARVNTVRLPVIRKNGHIELLPEGYDEATRTLTISAATYADNVSFATGVKAIRDLFSEFEFADGARSEAVAVSALMNMYAAQLVPDGELRPAFTYTKNAEGAGGTTCAACAIVPVLGYLPTGVKGGDDDEMRKLLSTTIREGRPVLLLDNMKGLLDSSALEAFVSSPTWNDRLLGVNASVSGPNNVTVFVTANGLTVTPDWRRRSLFTELHLSAERAEDRVFIRPLSVSVLKAMRSGILAACWSLVKNWDTKGRQQPSRSHSAFPVWASIIGGIVEAAGFACPLDTATSAVVADEDGDNMRTLTAAMRPKKRYSPQELVVLCRHHGVFAGLVGDSDLDMNRAHRSAFGKMLARYNNRLVGNSRFVVEGKGHQRRYVVDEVCQTKHGDMVAHGIRPEIDKQQKLFLGVKPCSTMPPCSPPSDHPRVLPPKNGGTVLYPKFSREGQEQRRKKA